MLLDLALAATGKAAFAKVSAGGAAATVSGFSLPWSQVGAAGVSFAHMVGGHATFLVPAAVVVVVVAAARSGNLPCLPPGMPWLPLPWKPAALCSSLQWVGKHLGSPRNPWAVIGLAALASLDLFCGGVVIHSWHIVAGVDLKMWLLGSIVLGAPVSLAVHLCREYSLRSAFCVEVVSTLSSSVWLGYGVYLLGGSSVATIQQAPLLYWTTYGVCAATWSGLTVVIFVIVLVMVAPVIVQLSGAPSRRAHDDCSTGA
mmetsp:Transcript_7574/g.17897  ORF Transcript_7574/g.17897 Transcript_7574/m.17897 type:complete len:257 (-) Transcript_7574:18-788(-)